MSETLEALLDRLQLEIRRMHVTIDDSPRDELDRMVLLDSLNKLERDIREAKHILDSL